LNKFAKIELKTTLKTKEKKALKANREKKLIQKVINPITTNLKNSPDINSFFMMYEYLPIFMVLS